MNVGETKRGRPPGESTNKKPKVEPSEPVVPVLEDLIKKSEELEKYFSNQIETIKKIKTETQQFFRDVIKRQKLTEKRLAAFQKKRDLKKEKRDAKKNASSSSSSSSNNF